MTRKYRLKNDSIDLRDIYYRSTQYKSVTDLPEEVDLRNKLSPIVDQGELGSCTANAIASGLGEFKLLQEGKPLTRLSRLFLYWQERYLEGTVNEDSGAYIRDGMKVLQTIGTCPESEYPYDIKNFTQTPTAKQVADAGAFRMISEYHRVYDLLSLKSALTEGFPVVIGILVYESFESEKVAQTGIVPLPIKSREQYLGGHAVLAVGYNKIGRTNYIIIRNSWGEEWGDKGYCYIPESFFSRGFVTDMWIGK
ncbi:C1 family peptidase [Ectobacillus funiculus]|uniref:C1 family peptidase n=1 Tax=Ectobacillus funiculus TaxID=137993 RepID=A0ABV5WAX5_9BACI